MLKPKGVFISVSYGGKERRLTQLQHIDFDWEIRLEKIVKMRQTPGDAETVTEELAEPEYQTIYICVKRGSDPLVESFRGDTEPAGGAEEEGEEEYGAEEGEEEGAGGADTGEE